MKITSVPETLVNSGRTRVAKFNPEPDGTNERTANKSALGRSACATVYLRSEPVTMKSALKFTSANDTIDTVCQTSCAI